MGIGVRRKLIAEKRWFAVPTFAVTAQQAHAMLRPLWRNDKHADSWMQTHERHAFPALGGLGVDRIQRADVLAILTSIGGCD